MPNFPIGTPVLRHFSPKEFRRPELMDADFLMQLDDFRTRCGFAMWVTSDARLPSDMHRLYGADWKRVDSAHLWREDYAVRCVDLVPVHTDLWEREEKELIMAHYATEMFIEGIWSYLGLEVAQRHLHIDDYNYPLRRVNRPTLWPGVSK